MQIIKQFKNVQNHLFASVLSEPKQGLLMDIWSVRDQSPQDLISVFDHSLLSIKDHKLSVWLSEVSKLDALFEMDAEASEAYLTSLLTQSSLKKFAFVYKSSRLHHVERITRVLLNCGVQVKGFTSSVMAMQWLLVPAVISKPHPVLEL